MNETEAAKRRFDEQYRPIWIWCPKCSQDGYLALAPRENPSLEGTNVECAKCGHYAVVKEAADYTKQWCLLLARLRLVLTQPFILGRSGLGFAASPYNE